MTSLLNRRNFLTGGLVTTLFTMSEQVTVMQDTDLEPQNKSDYLTEVLNHYLPEVDEDIKQDIVKKYADVSISTLRPLGVAASVAGAYGYLEWRKEGDDPQRPHKNTLLDKFGAAIGIPYFTNNMTSGYISTTQYDDIYNDISQYAGRMSQEDIKRTTDILSIYQASWQKSRLGILPAFMTAFFKENWEMTLDRFDKNVDNGGPRGPF